MPVANKTEYIAHPEGFFDATVGKIQEVAGLQFGPAFRVPFLTEEGEAEMLCSQSYSEKSKFGQFVAAALLKDWSDCPEQINTDRLEGLKVKIFVEHNDKGFAKVTKVKGNDLFASE